MKYGNFIFSNPPGSRIYSVILRPFYRNVYHEVDSCDTGYTLEEANILDFCGQIVDLNTHGRKRKLRRELSSLSRSSSRLVQRANFYFPVIEPILSENGIPDDFKYLMVVESGMDPYASSNKGAAGLWQFMPGTADDYGLTVNGRVDERFHIQKATEAACRYLNDAYDRFKDWVAVAQSYRAGAHTFRTCPPASVRTIGASSCRGD